ncbi:MAG: hypothetical protein M3Q86_04525 [Verrucomicrobiota bacterium]|nr:hypothetical protein [Verrucomicrobiota bacterium]
MKRILLALTMVGLLLPFAPKAQADTEVSLNLFYDNLSPHGSWIEVADYGYAFQPSVAVSNSDWRPYSDGYWAYTDLGWTWVSYEDFGWATYHYGRWANLDSFGWVWVPGYEWGPAWVSWRTGGDYVGWAPLPPQRGEVVYEGTAITNRVDIQFGIGPLYYNFVDIRYIGEPVLRGRILPATRNVTIINNTVNVTNITYNNSVVHNYGPDYNRLNQYSTRPVQRLTIQRETAVGASLTQGRKGNFNRVSGNQLTVVAPRIQKSQERVVPKQVKTKVENPTVETGWKGINNRQQVEAEMKKGDPKNIKAPDFQPQKDRKREAVAGADQNPAAPQPETAPAGAGQQAQDSQQAQQQQQREQAQQQREQNRQQREKSQQGEVDQAGQQAEAEKTRQENRKNRRGETRENAAPDASQPETAPQAEQAGQSDAEKTNRQQRAEERRAQRADQSRQQEQAQPNREPGADRQRNTPKAQQADENQSAADRSQPENNRTRRGQRSEGAQPTPAGEENARTRPQADQQPNRPERAPRQMQERRSQQEQARPQQEQTQPQQEQARPRQQQRQERQQGSGESTEGRQGKKQKPTEEPTPEP